MSWTTANIELSDNQAQIRCIDINRPSVRGGHNYIYIFITIRYKDNLDCYSLIYIYIYIYIYHN